MQSDHKLKQLLENLYACAGIQNAAQCAAQAMDYLNHPDGTLQQDLSVRALKGGTYKIKGYYMEDNDLTDIRGASTLISEVQDTILPQVLRKLIGFDCILYNGGGNLLALVSGNTDPDIAVQLEQEITAEVLKLEKLVRYQEDVGEMEDICREIKLLVDERKTILN